MATTRKKAQAATAADAKPADVAGASASAASATTSPTLLEGSGSGASTAPQSAGDGTGNPDDSAGDGQGGALGDQNTGGDTTGQGDGDADQPGGDTSTAGDQADPQTSGDTGGDGDQPSDQSEPNDNAPAPLLRRRLLNLCHGRQVLQTLATSLESGDAAYIEFRDAEHQAACERHIDALRSLNGWGDTEGLLWRDE